MAEIGRVLPDDRAIINAIQGLLLAQEQPLKGRNWNSCFERLVPSVKPPIGNSGAGLPLAIQRGRSRLAALKGILGANCSKRSNGMTGFMRIIPLL
jgi:hypothetical protein